MPRLFAVNTKRHTAATAVMISLFVTMLTMTLPVRVLAQGPALTTINEVRYSDVGWGAGYNGNLIGRFTSRSITLTRYARAQDYFLRSYDDSVPPRYSRYSAALHVDYPTS
ncbi:MAG: hypothetical protein WBW53_12860 [Terriglobales bacterium]